MTLFAYKNLLPFHPCQHIYGCTGPSGHIGAPCLRRLVARTLLHKKRRFPVLLGEYLELWALGSSFHRRFNIWGPLLLVLALLLGQELCRRGISGSCRFAWLRTHRPQALEFGQLDNPRPCHSSLDPITSLALIGMTRILDRTYLPDNFPGKTFHQAPESQRRISCTCNL